VRGQRYLHEERRQATHTVSKDAYLRILHATLTQHPAYRAGMALTNILPDGPQSSEIVLLASVPDRVRAAHMFDAVANEVRRHYVYARSELDFIHFSHDRLMSNFGPRSRGDNCVRGGHARAAAGRQRCG
jgi:hypothetical protein